MIATRFQHDSQHGRTLGEVFTESASASREGISFIGRERQHHTLSYAALLADARRLAAGLQAQGLQAGEPVLIVMDDEAALVRAFWGVMLAGGVTAPLTPPGSYSAHDPALQKICRVIGQCHTIHGRAPWLLTDLDAERLADQQDIAQCLQAGRMPALDGLSEGHTGDAPHQALPSPTIGADDVALLMFSSGSTGDPKGVRLTHRQLLCNLAQIAERSALDAKDRSLSWLPLTHDMGLVLFHLCHTLAGLAQFKMTPMNFARDPATLLDLASALRISLLGMPNFGFDLLCRLPDSAGAAWRLDSIRLIYDGAEPIDPVLTRRFLDRFARFGLSRHVISPGWGIAEACVVASAFPYRRLRASDGLHTRWIRGQAALHVGRPVLTADPAAPDAIEAVALGEAVPGLKIRVLDAQEQPLPAMHLGHLQIAGPNVTRGYLGQPEQEWVPTGDLGFIDEEGLIYLQGRAKDVLFINGRNFFSHDLEAALCHATDWAANQLAVVGYTDPRRHTERVVLFFRHRRADGDADPVARRLRHALEHLLGHPVAGAIPLPSLPKTTSGKVQRFALRQALQNGTHDEQLDALPARQQPPQREAAEGTNRLQPHLAQLLGSACAATIEPDVPLSHYGLDSVGYLQLASAIGAEDGREHDATAWMLAGTLNGIAACLDAAPARAHRSTLLRQIPLSPRQQALWMGEQIASASPPGLPGRYTEAYWLEFSGHLDPAAWLNAARAVLACHPLLTSRLVRGTDEPVLQHLGTPNFTVEHQCCPLSDFERRSRELAATPIPLTSGPVLRLCLLQAQDTTDDENPRWRLCVQTHHLLADGWSLYLLLNQCFRHAAGHPLPPAEAGLRPEPPGLSDDRIAAACKAGGDAQPMLPYASPQADERGSGPVQILRTRLSAHTLASLSSWISRGQHVFSLVSTALMALLSRMTGVDHGLIGTVASGRLHPDTHQRFGYLARSHVLHARIDAQTTFRQLLDTLDGQRQDIVAQQTPELCELQRHPAGASLPARIRTVYVHQNMPPLSLPDELRRLDDGAHRGLARVPLYLTSEWIDGTLRLQWEFDRDRLSLPQVEDLAELLDHLLGQALHAPDTPVALLSLLSPRQVAAWAPFRGEDRALDEHDTFMSRLESAARRWPLLTAVSDERHKQSYTALRQSVNALCHELQERHQLAKGDRVALLTSRETGYVVGLLALFKLGAVAVPLDPALPAERIRTVLAHSGARLLLSTPGLTLDMSTGLPHVHIDSQRLAGRGEHPGNEVRGLDPAYLIFTSGSTGTPKGVTICHRSLTNLIDWVIHAFEYRAGETLCQFAPFSFDVSMAEILPSLCAGMHVHVLPDARRASPEGYLQTMQEQGARVATLTPAYVSVLNEIPERCRQSLASLRLLIMGGEALPLDTVKRWHAHSPHVRMVNVYGPTETTVMSSAYRIDDPDTEDRRILPLGTPISNTDFLVLDARLQPCPRGVEGRLHIGGIGLARGYWQDEARTHDAFPFLCPDPGQGPRRYYDSGDLARLDHDGALEFIGRADNQVKLRGFRIELGDVEQAMLRCSGVQEGVATIIQRTDQERVLVVYWRGPETDPEVLSRHLKTCLPAYMQPAACCRVEQWPLTPNRKIDRRRLPPPTWHAAAETPAVHEAAAGPQASQAPAPAAGTGEASPLQQRLADLWKGILGLDSVRASDEFPLLGGNSLSTARLVNQIRTQLGLDVSLADVMTTPKLSDMAALLERASPLARDPLALTDPGRHGRRFPFPASQAQARMIYLDSEHPDTALNTIPLTLELDAALDPARLQAAMRTLHARHDLLRCRFDLTSQQPMLQDGAPCPVPERMTPADDAAAMTALSAFHARPHATAEGPLWRVATAESPSAGKTRHWLALSMHHAISDGVTLARLLRELDALLRGETLPPIDGEAHYADYVDWQTRWLDSEAAAPAREHWRTRPRLPAPTPLPRQPGRQETPGVAGRQFVFELDEQASATLATLSRKNGVSPFVLMSTLFSLVIARHCEVGAMTTGITLSGRSRPEFETVMGLMVNTLPLEFDWQEDECFDTLLARMAERVARLIDFQDYPLNRVLADQGISGTPFTVLFNEEVLPASPRLGHVNTRLARVSSGVAKLPMVISCLQLDGRWCARFEIRHDVCPPDWVSGVLADIRCLARHLDGMDGARLSELQGADEQLLSLLDRTS